MEELLGEIEELRYQLYHAAKDKFLIDPEVVDMSQQLDRLLNKYYEITSLSLS